MKLSAPSIALLMFAAGAAHALEFKSVGAAPAVLYDAPSEKGRKVFVAPRGMPVEIILTYGEWTKIRDTAGDLSWVESKALSPKRTLVISAANAKARIGPDDNAPLVFTADKGVMLELVEAGSPGWLKVRHRDGQSAYLRVADVWGE